MVERGTARSRATFVEIRPKRPRSESSSEARLHEPRSPNEPEFTRVRSDDEASSCPKDTLNAETLRVGTDCLRAAERVTISDKATFEPSFRGERTSFFSRSEVASFDFVEYSYSRSQRTLL